MTSNIMSFPLIGAGQQLLATQNGGYLDRVGVTYQITTDPAVGRMHRGERGRRRIGDNGW
jgi:hypothetical protein